MWKVKTRVNIILFLLLLIIKWVWKTVYVMVVGLRCGKVSIGEWYNCLAVNNSITRKTHYLTSTIIIYQCELYTERRYYIIIFEIFGEFRVRLPVNLLFQPFFFLFHKKLHFISMCTKKINTHFNFKKIIAKKYNLFYVDNLIKQVSLNCMITIILLCLHNKK